MSATPPNIANTPAYVDPALLSVPAAQQPTCPGPSTALPTALSIGTMYSFLNVGDQIPTHAHAAGTGHYSIIAQGEVEFTEYDSTGVVTSQQVFSAPAAIAVPDGVSHSFTGLIPGAVVFNILYAITNPASIKTMIGNAVASLQQALTAAQAAQNLTV